MPSFSHRRSVPLAIGLLVVLATVPGLALAAPVQGAGGSVTVGPNETVDGVEGLFGTVVIQGTVTGDVDVAAGSVVITGEVGGDVSGAAGSVDIRGRVGGDVSVGAGSLTLAEDAVIGGRLNAGVGSAVLAGTVGGDASLGGGDIVLEETATFRGDVRYDGDLTDRGATVDGRLIHDDSIGAMDQPFRGIGDVVVDVYGFLVSLVVGLGLLAAIPERSRRLAGRVIDEPLRTGLVGLGILIGVPIGLLLLAFTIIGIPLSIIGALLFALVAWIGSIYGRYAVGEWLLGYTGVDNRWVALVVGMVAVALIGLVPWLGGLVSFVVLLLGLGGIAVLTLEAYRARRVAAAA